MRIDARDNRTRILAAADQVFGKQGPGASTEDVARLAEVGIATVFRHFPTKRELLSEVLTARLEQLRDRARALSDVANPGEAFFVFFTELVGGAAEKLSIAEALRLAEGAAGTPEAPAPLKAGAQLRRSIGHLLERAQTAGAVRADAALPETFALMIGVSRGVAYTGLSPQATERLLGFVFDGLRAR